MPALPADALPSATLVWDGGQLPDCDRSAELRRNVNVYLGRDAFEDGAPLTIRITPRRARRTREIVAEVSQFDEQGRPLGVRSVSGGTVCEALDEPLTLVVALMLDAPPPPVAAERPDPEPPPPPPNEQAAAAEESEQYGPISVVPEPSTEVPPGHAFLSVGVGTSLGQLPFLSYGAQLQAGLKPRHFWGLELSGGVLGGSSVDLPVSGAIDFGLVALGAALCPLDSLREGLLLRGCGGLQVAWLRATSRGLEPNHRRSEVVFSPELHLQVAQHVGRNFFLGGGFGLLFPIGPSQYTYRNPEGVRAVAFQMSSPSLNLGLFVARRLP